jgi:hypothetical protein
MAFDELRLSGFAASLVFTCLVILNSFQDPSCLQATPRERRNGPCNRFRVTEMIEEPGCPLTGCLSWRCANPGPQTYFFRP